MATSKKLLFLPLTLLLGASLVLGGCQAAKKPEPKNTGNIPAPTNQTNPNTQKATNPNQAYPRHIADKVVNEANKVQGVRGSAAVVSGKNVYLGLDLNANLEKSKSAQVEKNVLNRVKKLVPGYTVTVTSDVDIVTRIKRVSQGIAQGKTIASFNKELQEISNRLKPRSK